MCYVSEWVSVSWALESHWLVVVQWITISKHSNATPHPSLSTTSPFFSGSAHTYTHYYLRGELFFPQQFIIDAGEMTVSVLFSASFFSHFESVGRKLVFESPQGMHYRNARFLHSFRYETAPSASLKAKSVFTRRQQLAQTHYKLIRTAQTKGDHKTSGSPD